MQNLLTSSELDIASRATETGLTVTVLIFIMNFMESCLNKVYFGDDRGRYRVEARKMWWWDDLYPIGTGGLFGVGGCNRTWAGLLKESSLGKQGNNNKRQNIYIGVFSHARSGCRLVTLWISVARVDKSWMQSLILVLYYIHTYCSFRDQNKAPKQCMKR